MKKWLWIILMVLVLPSIEGAIVIEYSVDNATWINITNVNEPLIEGYQINLNGETIYYFRGRNESDNWSYTLQRTAYGGVNKMIIALTVFSIFFVFLGGFLLYWRRHREKNVQGY